MYRFAIILFFLNIFSTHLIFANSTDSTTAKSSESLALTSIDPSSALIYSAILPGTGQMYAESYFHGTVFFSLNGYFLYKIVSKQMEAADFKDKWNQNPNIPGYEQQYLDAFESRNMHIWLWAFTYMLNLMDAYVEASLYNFDNRIDLKVDSGFIDSPGEIVPAVTLQIGF